MIRDKTPEQQERIAAAQANYEVVKPYIALFREVVLEDDSKEAEADAMFANLTGIPG